MRNRMTQGTTIALMLADLAEYGIYTGDRAQIDQMLKAYRVYSRKVPGEGDAYLMDHTASVYLLDANAGFAGTFDDQEKEDVAFAKLQRLVGSAS